MADPVTIGLAAAAGVVAIAAGWLQWPRPPALDGERWFKITLASMLLGRVDAEKGEDDEWAEGVLRFVPYHPAGRLPERKVVQPLAEVPGARLEGELALQEKLATLEGLDARWAWMYDEDPVAIEARTQDPFELGTSYDPETLVGPGFGWEALTRWGGGDPGFRDALIRRLGARWALVEGRSDRAVGPSLAQALTGELPELLRVEWEEGELADQVERVRVQLSEPLVENTDPLVVLAEEAGATLLLRALQSDAGLRDRVAVVVSIGGVLLGRPAEDGPFGERDATDWMAAWFTLDHFDSELVQLKPFLAIQWLDRAAPTPGSKGLPLQAQRFPAPVDDDVIATLETVDLGPLPVLPDLPVDQVARAVIATAGMWALARK